MEVDLFIYTLKMHPILILKRLRASIVDDDYIVYYEYKINIKSTIKMLSLVI